MIYHFVKTIAREENRKNISAIQPLVLQTLIAYDWPGNIRELENAIFRAMILCEGEELSIDEFPQIVSQLPDFDLQATLPDQTASENIQSVAAPLLQTPDEPVPSRGSEFAMQPTLSETANATGDFGMVRLISAEGQVKTLEEIEGEAIRFAIEIYNGRMSEIARRLAIGRSTLYRKMKEHQIDTDQNEAEPENASNWAFPNPIEACEPNIIYFW